MSMHLAPELPAALRDAAPTILGVHVAAGGLAVVTGAAALIVRKGSQPHRMAGHVFFGAMIVMALGAAVLGPMLTQPRDPVGALFVVYLVATAWAAGRFQPGPAGRFEQGAFAAALAFVALSVAGVLLPSGIAGPGGSAVLGIVAGGAAWGDYRVMRAGRRAGAPRLQRHIWRMCAGLFVATGSFFLGQQKVMPEFVRGSPLLLTAGFAPLLAMAWFLFRHRSRGDRVRPAAA